ncbi:MAG TPA: response regulator [Acidobacteriaceae bacterium]|nr:response regulator [Acidobacteriaceae bacterium]
MTQTRILLVDDDELVRMALTGFLEQSGFAVTSAANVSEALKLISGTETYDVLLSDLHMPGAGDGLTVVSAMRHVNPKAVTLLLSAFPEMSSAVMAILQQADEILVKPMEMNSLVRIIRERVASGPNRRSDVETVAAILERFTAGTIREWYQRVESEPSLMAVPMTCEERCAQFPILFRDLVLRLNSEQTASAKLLTSSGAAEYGASRFRHGYSASMLADEFRALQLSIFHTLQRNLARIDPSILLSAVMTIADELNAQLSRALKAYAEQTLYVEAVGRLHGAYGG